MSREIKLPEPKVKGFISVEEALAKRRSRRRFKREPISLEQLSQLLWAAQGITDKGRGFRTAPSAGATFPLEIYVVVKAKGIEKLEPGIYKYSPANHTLRLIRNGDFSYDLYSACLDQPWVLEAPVNIIITAVYRRTTSIYGRRGAERYVPMEAGHVGQNIYLQAEALGLGTVAIGAFYDERVHEIIGSPKGEIPLYVFPIGKPF